ncbi:uncharacterized protein LOC131226616 [Magnolia sinica]|uniref:uncharacterized protein LOC131226616 n=1 Tax=Magnolia sinica TaxID=86752 RepID=UPI00265A2D19|nr:uncharacterized protein LOC131226616 [Magnolia sinica]
MIVAQYEAIFAELSRYVTRLDEDYKITRLEEGLRQNIRTRFCCADIQKYSEIVDKALRAERDCEHFLKSKVGSQSRTAPNQQQPLEKRQWMHVQAAPLGNQEQHFPENCSYCGKYGHKAQVCRTRLKDMGVMPLQQIPPRVQLPVPTQQSGQASCALPSKPPQNQHNRPQPPTSQNQRNQLTKMQPSRARVYSIHSIAPADKPEDNHNIVEGKPVILDKICKSVLVILGGIPMIANLVVMDMFGYDIIFSIDWLTPNHVKLDCYEKTVGFSIPRREPFTIQGKQMNERIERIMLLMNGETPELSVDQIPVVREYQEVFQDIPGLPPCREVDFGINLLPGSAQISMSHIEWRLSK